MDAIAQITAAVNAGVTRARMDTCLGELNLKNLLSDIRSLEMPERATLGQRKARFRRLLKVHGIGKLLAQVARTQPDCHLVARDFKVSLSAVADSLLSLS